LPSGAWAGKVGAGAGMGLVEQAATTIAKVMSKD
jgi:hypothetical protein